ncbi:MAG: hypothetical protein JO257_02335 [Deltaproteobacteria bacterium]|nr:hypothetical protein [Deltaproteobacteria bacterium]
MKSVVALLLASACGRFGFDAQKVAGDGAISDGDGADTGSAGSTFTPWWHSGPRLRARLLVGGGDPIFYGWHDTALASDCQPTLASDGVERCMPFRARVGPYFADAACTQSLAIVYKGTCGSDSYAFDDSAGSVTEYPIAGLFAGTVYQNVGGCTIASLPINTEAHIIGAAAQPTQFLASTYHRQQVGSFLHSFNDYADGATIDIGSLVLGNTSCAPQLTQLGPAPCTAGARRATLGYSDAMCTKPVLIWARTPYDPPTASELVVYPPQACDSAYTYYQTIANVTGPSYYIKHPGSCDMIPTPGNVVMYTATQMADPSPTGTIVKGPDRGRIGTFYWIGPDQVGIAVGNFDQQLGLPCLPFNASDGMLRCLPQAAVRETANENASCTGSIGNLAGECFGVPPLSGPTYSSCIDNGVRVRPLTASFASASLSYDGACTTIDLPNGIGYDATSLGSELPPSMFPALAEMIE